MSKTLFEVSSAFYNRQVASISSHMHIFIEKAALFSSSRVEALNQTTKRFMEEKAKAYRCRYMTDNATNNAEGLAKDKITALNDMQIRYEILLADDIILREDFASLAKNIATSQSLSISMCHKILMHLIAEIKEGTIDEQRLEDESFFPLNRNDISDKRLAERFKLQCALEDYQRTYLMPI